MFFRVSQSLFDICKRNVVKGVVKGFSLSAQYSIFFSSENFDRILVFHFITVNFDEICLFFPQLFHNIYNFSDNHNLRFSITFHCWNLHFVLQTFDQIHIFYHNLLMNFEFFYPVPWQNCFFWCNLLIKIYLFLLIFQWNFHSLSAIFSKINTFLRDNLNKMYAFTMILWRNLLSSVTNWQNWCFMHSFV